MQNRFTLTGLPKTASGWAAAVREIIEEEICWVDRCADLEDGSAAFELHLENMRDLAVKTFHNYVMSPDSEHCCTVHAAPITTAQSAELLEKCPENGKGEESGQKVSAQQLHFGNNNGERVEEEIVLRVQVSGEGGTGAAIWRGGVLLAEGLCQWHLRGNHPANAWLKSIFTDSDILELGCGSTALPSLVLGKMGAARSITASDCMDEVLSMVRANISENGLDDIVSTRCIDWAEFSADSQQRDHRIGQYDAIMFADCVYTKRGAQLLCDCIPSLLREGGAVFSVTPPSDFRVGIDIFEQTMKAHGQVE